MEYKIILILIVILLGTLGPIQTGVNSTLSNYLSHPSQAAFISFLGGNETKDLIINKIK